MKHGEGSKNTQKLTDIARSTNTNQGQWLDNKKVADLLNDNGKVTDVTIITIPEGLGQVITPKGILFQPQLLK